MFGGNLDPPKYVKHKRPKPMRCDVQMPAVNLPGHYGHMARPLNTDYHVQYLHWKQRLRDEHTRMINGENKRLLQEAITAKYDAHCEKKVFQRHIKERFKEKIDAYEASIEERRQKLRALLCEEEQEFIRDTIDQAQKGVDNKMEEMKVKAQLLKAQREEERLAVVKEKRMMQMIEDCVELRPVLFKKNLVESKLGQLKQMEEKEGRKTFEKDMDKLWYEVMIREMNVKLQREIDDKRKQRCSMQEAMDVWEKQIEGKKLLREEQERAAVEERKEMVKLMEQIRREEIELMDKKRRKRDQIAMELKQQIQLQEKYAIERKKAEDALNDAFNKMAKAEIERERQKLQDTTSLARRETAVYRAYLKQLDEDRKKEEKELLDLLEEHRIIIEKKEEDAYCKLKEARDKLQRDVLAGRAQQLEDKRKEAENQLRLQEAENELMRMALETNERLQAEHDRLQMEAVKQYREDLKKQIEDNNEKRRLEREHLEKELAEGLAEEERHRKQLVEIFQKRLFNEDMKHPFKRFLERTRCPCPQSQID